MTLIGETQTLIDGSNTLTLTWDNFNAEFDSELGYVRSPQPLPTVEYSIASEGIVRSLRLGPRFELKWGLWLRQDKLLTLSSMVRRQIVLRDTRLPVTEALPIIRAAYSVLYSDTFSSTFYPQMDVYLTDVKWEPFLDDGEILYKVELTGYEV